MSEAHDRLIQAQSEMEKIVEDIKKIDEFTAWLGQSDAAVEKFTAYYQSQWIKDREADDAPILDVIGEDPGFDAIVEHHRAMQSLVRAAVEIATRSIAE